MNSAPVFSEYRKPEHPADTSKPQVRAMPSLCLHQASGGGIHHVGSNSADNDQIDLLQIDRMRLHQLLNRFHGEIAGGNALVHQMALADPRAFQDPLIGGINHFFQVLIGEDAGRNVGAKRCDLGATSVRQ